VLSLGDVTPLFAADSSQVAEMAKSKNHTAHNQTYKAHRNGIKRPPTYKYKSRKGVRTEAPSSSWHAQLLRACR
jgi:large subunit ribosomal protein L29e